MQTVVAGELLQIALGVGARKEGGDLGRYGQWSEVSGGLGGVGDEGVVGGAIRVGCGPQSACRQGQQIARAEVSVKVADVALSTCEYHAELIVVTHYGRSLGTLEIDAGLFQSTHHRQPSRPRTHNENW